MSRDDIIRMALEAGFSKDASGLYFSCGGSATDSDLTPALDRFAEFVAAEKQQKMIRDGWRQCAEGQRTTQYCGLLEAAVQAERERCAEIARQMDEIVRQIDQYGLSNYGAVIAARILAKDRA